MEKGEAMSGFKPKIRAVQVRDSHPRGICLHCEKEYWLAGGGFLGCCDDAKADYKRWEEEQAQ